LSAGKGTELGKFECTLKKLNDRLSFILKRERLVKLVLAVIAVVLLSGIMMVNVRSIYQASSTISSVGSFKAIGIEVYRNEGLTDRVTKIDWGLLQPGAKKTYPIYINNEGNFPLTLRLTTSNWNPPFASNYLTLTWDLISFQTINAGEAVKVTLTLTVSDSITGIGSFTFDIIAEGSG